MKGKVGYQNSGIMLMKQNISLLTWSLWEVENLGFYLERVNCNKVMPTLAGKNVLFVCSSAES